MGNRLSKRKITRYAESFPGIFGGQRPLVPLVTPMVMNTQSILSS